MNRDQTQGGAAHNTVILPGQEIVFKNPNGSGKIVYVSEFVRRYEVLGGTYLVDLKQRAEEWRHQKGLYNPGESFGRLNLEDDVPSRFVVEESEVRFGTLEESSKFFKEGAAYYKWVSNDQGLVLGFDFSPGRDQVNVSLYRCFIDGQLMGDIPSQFKYPGFVRLK